MKDNFINQFDPTKPIEDVSIETQYSKLSEDDKLLLFLKLKGFSHCPPTIERFYSDEFYLGGKSFFDSGKLLFNYWKDILNTVYPSPVLTRYPMAYWSGSIGGGKSTVTKLCLCYNLCRLACLRSVSKTFGLAPKPLSVVIFHRNEMVADIEFKRYITENAYINSPFFRNRPNKHDIRIYTGGVLSNPALGTDLILGVISEINFFPNTEKAIEKINNLYGRMTSRFSVENHLTMVGGLFIDSSVSGDQAAGEVFLENSDPRYTIHTQPSHWEVRPELYKSSNGKTFPVYTGSGKYPACILPEDYRLADDQSEEQVIRVPIQLLPEFQADFIKALTDKAGKCSTPSDSFFNGDITHIVNCSRIKNRIPEIITVDFYDKTQHILDQILPMIQHLPYRQVLYCGLDLGIRKDITGLSLISFEGWKYFGEAKLPKIKVHCIVGIGRKQGQQTSISHIEDLIFSLSKRFTVITSFDQFQSMQIGQDLEREGLHTQYVSTDRSPEVAIYLKNLFQNELIEMPEHKRFMREAFDLRFTLTNGGKTKIDHPQKASQTIDVNNGVGSKDIWDSLASACYSFKLNADQGLEMGYGQGMVKQMEALKDLTKDPREETQKQFQGMLEGIF